MLSRIRSKAFDGIDKVFSLDRRRLGPVPTFDHEFESTPSYNMSPRAMEERNKFSEAMLQMLPEGYFEEAFEPVLHELRQLSGDVNENLLEELVERRTGALEVVTERLSGHVLQNYDKFVDGINEVASIESHLQSAVAATKMSRQQLALALKEVETNIRIAKQTRQKQALVIMLDILTKLQQANNLHSALKEATESSEYAEAFWLCAQVIKSLDEMDNLQVLQELRNTITSLYEGTVERLEGAVSSVCNDFKPEHYSKVLEGYMFLDSVPQLGQQLPNTFTTLVGNAVLKTVRSVMLTRKGCEDKAARSSNLQELVKALPSDLFRTCLASVLMVVFDILVSHHTMSVWHDEALAAQAIDAATTHKAIAELKERMEKEGGSPGVPVGVNGGASELQHDTQDDKSSADMCTTGSREMSLSEQLEELEAKEREQQDWGTVLNTVHAGLVSSRKLLWDEASRKIAILLVSPAAFEGEHFLQVLEWTQRILAAGETFSGGESSALRGAVQRQSATFFKAYHTSNMEALDSMLEKELWSRLPAVSTSNLRDALLMHTPSSSTGSRPEDAGPTDFKDWVVKGNPWRSQGNRRRGFSFRIAADRGGAAQQLDDYGLPQAQHNEANGVSPDLIADPSSDEDEAEELYGDSIDEDSQTVTRSRSESSVRDDKSTSVSGRNADSALNTQTVTASSWRMLKWMKDYAELMRVLRSASATVFGGICELFDLYLLHTFATFSDVTLQQILEAQSSATNKPAIRAEVITPRLQGTLSRIVNDSLARYPDLIAYQKGLPAKEAGTAASTTETAFHRFREKHLATAQRSLTTIGLSADMITHTASSSSSKSEQSKVSNSGNMYGLRERTVAVESLMAVAAQLKRSRGALQSLMPSSENASVDFFYSRTVGAAGDVRDSILRTGARLNISLGWMPDSIASANYVLMEPPVRHGAWVDQLLSAVKVFRDKLSAVDCLNSETIEQMWDHMVQYIAELMLEGIARVKRCSLEGRAAMSVDYQGVSRGLDRLKPPECHINLRLVDNYIKGFYIPPSELPHWSATHREFTKDQVLALTSLIADNAGLKRKDRTTLLMEIEAVYKDTA